MKDLLNLNLIHLRVLTLLVIFLGFNFSTVVSAETVPRPENHLTIGASIVSSSAPFEGTNGYVTPMPIFDIRVGDFFLFNEHDEPIFGYDLFFHKRIQLAFAITRTRAFLDLGEVNESVESLYFGLQDRDSAVEAGFIFQFHSRVGLFELTTFHDITDHYDGIKSSISMSRPIPDTGRWKIVPRVFVKHYSEKYNRFYYGVTEAETNKGAQEAIDRSDINITKKGYKDGIRDTYVPGTSGHFGASISFEYLITDHLKGRGFIEIEKFSGQIETSPLIEDKELTTLSLGLSYTF